MSAAPDDAYLSSYSDAQFESLVKLYDTFAHELDPFSGRGELAEQAFNLEVASWYDRIPDPKPPLPDFKRAVVRRCKQRILKNIRRIPG